MSDLLYRAIRVWGIFLRYRVVGKENIQRGGPGIYVANHCGTLGPLPFFLSAPERLYPWVKADLVDSLRSPRYLYNEFVHPILHLQGGVGMAAATACSWLATPLLQRLGCIPVESSTEWVGGAFRASLALLVHGQSVLIFPEDAQEGEADPQTGIYPFACGFVELCRIYQKATRNALPVYPMAALAAARTIAIGPAMFYRDEGIRRQAMRRFADEARQRVGALYLALEAQGG